MHHRQEGHSVSRTARARCVLVRVWGIHRNGILFRAVSTGSAGCPAPLEFLNVMIATTVWAKEWSGKRVQVFCDNSNTVIAKISGRIKDPYMQGTVFDMQPARHRGGGQAQARLRDGEGRRLFQGSLRGQIQGIIV